MYSRNVGYIQFKTYYISVCEGSKFRREACFLNLVVSTLYEIGMHPVFDLNTKPVFSDFKH
jgi:hypothetical protein